MIFVLCIALVSLAFLPFNTEYVVYNVLLIASMLSGYLDDAAETAWNEYKKASSILSSRCWRASPT